ncbi:hypothetical protein J7E63_18060 [Bacillus sp. ISL-75]|uniref:hypothetical protein n=1 Tax=Bacillus sp. ISL-75 TaxID=2819137 RepID=UPI001BE614FC|nr:hypothetical protein [Bacillus sp. ISL-75]MBT2728824.1 hypothetical protein [Bacillus sp. ISL-75]
MWIWIIVFSLFIVLLIVLEEAGHYILNRYLDGHNNGRQLKWKKRMMTVLTLIKKKIQTERHEMKEEKSL